MKRAAALILIIISVILTAPLISAESSRDAPDVNTIIKHIQQKLDSSTQKDIRNALSSKDINVGKPDSLSKIKPKGIIESALSIFTDAIRSPLVTLGKIIAVALVCIVIKSVSTPNDAMSSTVELLCLICTVVLLTDTLTQSFKSVRDSIESINKYLLAYLPVFSGITLAGG